MKENQFQLIFSVRSEKWCDHSIVERNYWILTLLGVNARGFLALRTTLKLTILAAMLKPFNRATAPINEFNLVNPRESISPSVLGYKPSVWACPALHFLTPKYLVLWWWDVIVLIPSCFKSFRRSLLNRFTPESVSCNRFTMAKEFNLSSAIVSQSRAFSTGF